MAGCYAVVSRQGRITVGTRRGVVRVDDSLRVERVAPAFADAVLAVFPAGDTVWVGTPRGLLLVASRRPGCGAARPPWPPRQLQAPVVALGSLGDTLVALTRDQLLWRDPAHRGLDARPQPQRRPRRPGGVRGRRAGLLGGRRPRRRLRAASARRPVPPLDRATFPGAANDVAVDRDFLWVATDAGLVRFRLDAVRP